ncbi:MAG: hypothetical protein JWR08_1228 [Enterovirga sp.]|nr:hypothetical protein [Enterovirga sp.]
MRALLTLLVSVILTVAATSGWAASDRRVALVIGNSAYRKFPQLPNPKNDAEDVSAALKKVGFTVLGGADLTRENMRDSLRQFARAAQDAEAALVFYAGHGLQYRGRNYLVPVDAKLEDEFDLEYETVRVDDILEELNRADGARILILDACRNLPLATRARDPFSSTGLAKLSGRGLIVAYATQANQVAYDGTGRNSIFTGAFVKAVQEPGIDAAQMFQRVSMNVDRQTNGRQTPELSLSYPGQFFFNRAETEREAWPRVRASADPQALRDFIARYPDSFLVDDAKEMIQRLEARRPGGAPAGAGEQVAARPLGLGADASRGTPARRPEDESPPQPRAREEDERAVWQRLQEEQKRRAEARQQAEQQRLANEGRERQRLAEEARLEEARQRKLAEEKAAAEVRDRQRLAAEAKAEEERRRVEARRAEQERLADEARQRKIAEERTAAEARERQRAAQEAKLEEERRRVEARRLEQERVAEEARLKRLADDKAAAEARERQRLAQEARQEEERRLADARRAEQERLAEDARQRRFAEEAAAAERQRAALEGREAEERRRADAAASARAQQERDQLAWLALEEQQRRRAAEAVEPARARVAASATGPDAASPAEGPPNFIAAGSSDGSVDRTLSALKSGRASSVPSALQPGPGAADSAQQPIRLALADPAQPAVTAPPPASSAAPRDALSEEKLVRDVQAELGRIGCYDEGASGEWDTDSRDALRRFGRLAKLSPIPTRPSPDLLDDLRSRPAKFCPLECGAGERLAGDHCVAVARPEAKPVRKPKPAPAVARREPEPRPAVQARPRPQSAPPQAPVAAAAAPRAAPRAVMGVGF